ncbi:MAG: YeeE/YedE family protein [Proteobacteria bacterium]|nr:YeeE/YedE family protein [Pseudomonadota bacterium]
MRRTIEFLVGLLFGWGLLLSGMTDPGKVQGFLDLFGHWDPSLAFVMGGAIAVGVFAFALAKRRAGTMLFGDAMRLPASNEIDRRLIAGSLIFGAGWGLAGFCPGPGIVAMAAGQPKAAVFVAAMLVGMLGFALLQPRMDARQGRAAG